VAARRKGGDERPRAPRQVGGRRRQLPRPAGRGAHHDGEAPREALRGARRARGPAGAARAACERGAEVARARGASPAGRGVPQGLAVPHGPDAGHPRVRDHRGRAHPRQPARDLHAHPRENPVPVRGRGRREEAGRRGREGREVPGALCYARASGGGIRGRHPGYCGGATSEATKGVMPCDGPSSPSTISMQT
jgi:hypothetical protein